jgi:enoyl-CoA hydratase
VGYDSVTYEAGRVARVMLDRPQYRNAQSSQLLNQLDAAFTEAVADAGVRVIVMSGVGEAFSAGHDLGTPDQLTARAAHTDGRQLTEAEDHFSYSWDHFLDMSLRWRDLPKPTIAMVHGWCIFGGWLISSAMDLIVAADDARFMTALLQYFPLPYDVGPRKAKELLFDNQVISGVEAHEMGFVNRVFPSDRLEEETMAFAARIAENSSFFLRMAKVAVNNAQDAMGFKAAVTAAHSHYMLSQLSNSQWARINGRDSERMPDRRRLSAVDRVLNRDEPRT